MRMMSLARLPAVGMLLALVALTVVSCGNGNGGATVELVEQVPAEAASFVYWDVATIEDDSDLQPLLDQWQSAYQARIEGFGLQAAQVRHFLDFSTGQDSGLIVTGDLERDRIRTQLRNRNYTDGDYKSFEVWEAPGQQAWMAMLDGSLVGGPPDLVKGSINVVQGGRSLYDDQDARDVMDRLPDGIVTRFQRQGVSPPYEGLVASGDCLRKRDRDTLRIDLLCKFSDPAQAADAIDAISEAADEVYQKVAAEQDGRFVTVEAEVRTERVSL